MGLRNLYFMPTTPPRMISNSFYLVLNQLTVTVPCASLQDYRNARFYNLFTNFSCTTDGSANGNGNNGGDNGGNNGGGQGVGSSTNYVVRYNSNGGNGYMSEQTVASNTVITLRACQFARAGCTFTCWNTSTYGTGASYYPGYEVTIICDITFYAQWSRNETNAINSAAMASVSVYPTPATTMVTVNGTIATRIDVLDLAGRTVRTVEGTNTISLNGLANGVYTLRITAAEGMALRKIVKK